MKMTFDEFWIGFEIGHSGCRAFAAAAWEACEAALRRERDEAVAGARAEAAAMAATLVKRWRWVAALETTLATSKAQQAGWSQCADELEKATPVDAQAALASRVNEAVLKEHANHVQFFNDLYATLVDPVAEGSIKENVLMEKLITSAEWYRQRVYDLEKQTNEMEAWDYEKDATIARLQAQLSDLEGIDKVCDFSNDLVGKMQADIDQQDAEIKRLQAELVAAKRGKVEQARACDCPGVLAGDAFWISHDDNCPNRDKPIDAAEGGL